MPDRRPPRIRQGALALAILCMALSSTAVLAQQDVAPTVAVADHPEVGEILVDGRGMSLYLFTKDQDGGSACTGDCADAWPPVLVDGAVGFGDGVDLGALGAIARDDGSMQLTYNGHPLYTFAQDQSAGDVQGQGVNDSWYLLGPDGDAVEAALGGGDQVEDISFDRKMEIGHRVFGRICSECHGDEGDEPKVSHAVVLADSERNVGRADRVIRTVLRGGGYMPAFGDQLSDEEIASVVTFIRNSWGNDFEPVTVQEVADMR